jgi:hypothetical protein
MKYPAERRSGCCFTGSTEGSELFQVGDFAIGIVVSMKLFAYWAATILAHAVNAIPQHFGSFKARNVSSSPCAVVSSSAAAALTATPSGMDPVSLYATSARQMRRIKNILFPPMAGSIKHHKLA